MKCMMSATERATSCIDGASSWIGADIQGKRDK